MMRLTQTHAAFWFAHHAPAWCRPVVGGFNVDACVNAHAGSRVPAYTITAGNLCSILRMMRRRGANLRDELWRIAANPGTTINPTQRARYARRWAVRAERQGER